MQHKSFSGKQLKVFVKNYEVEMRDFRLKASISKWNIINMADIVISKECDQDLVALVPVPVRVLVPVRVQVVRVPVMVLLREWNIFLSMVMVQPVPKIRRRSMEINIKKVIRSIMDIIVAIDPDLVPEDIPEDVPEAIQGVNVRVGWMKLVQLTAERKS